MIGGSHALTRCRRPAVANLVEILASLEGVGAEEVVRRLDGGDAGALKQQLASTVAAHVGPIASRMQQLSRDPTHVDVVLRAGAARARSAAAATLAGVKAIIGL